MIVLDTDLTEKNRNKELGLQFDGSLQGFSCCPPKTCKPNKQTTWNRSHLHGIAWKSGNLDYDKLFAVFYDINVINAEVFAKGLEKCRLLTRLLDQIVENLDDQKFKILLEKEKRTNHGAGLVTLSGTKQRFTVPRGKEKFMENGLSNIFNYKFCACLLFLCLLINKISQLDIIFSIQFSLKDMSVQN